MPPRKYKRMPMSEVTKSLLRDQMKANTPKRKSRAEFLRDLAHRTLNAVKPFMAEAMDLTEDERLFVQAVIILEANKFLSKGRRRAAA